MQSDKKSNYLVNVKSNTKLSNKDKEKEKEKKRSYKKNESSDDDNNDDDSDIVDEEDDDVVVKKEKFDKKKYIKLLSEIFPSKYMNERVKQMKLPVVKNKNQIKIDDVKKKNVKKEVIKPVDLTPPPQKRRLKKIIVSDSEEETTPKHSQEEEEEQEEEDEEYVDNEEDEEEEDDEDDEDYVDNEEDEEEEDDEEDEEYIDNEEDEEEEDDEEDEYRTPRKNNNLSKYNIILSVGNPTTRQNNQDDYFKDGGKEEEEEYEEKMKLDEEKDELYDFEESKALNSLRNIIDGLTEKDKKNKSIIKMITDFEKREKAYNKGLKKFVLKKRENNTRRLSSLLNEKNVMNDVKYFHEKLPLEEQYKILKQLMEIKKHSTITKPYRLTLLDADIPLQYKAIAYKKINTLKYMEQGGGEYYKIKNWVDTFMQIPFGKTKNLPITIDDGVEKCHEFMEKANKILDEAVYGLDDVKLQIMQMVGQWISNPKAMGTAIAIKGPMGTGKTSLVKEGISKILGREFAFIALGGATDSSFLEGHSYTYEGSTWGKIVDILVKCQSMNPVIFFDELDKVSETAKGEEIIGILTHLTDTTQNSKFHDKYFSELDFDLSKCLFIFSYNDERKVNPILRDRMYRIETKGYEAPEKFVISKEYLIPKICEQVRFEKDDIIIPEETIKYLITNHTDGEQGVRNLKRCLEIIYTKLNLYRLMKPGNNLFKKEMSLDIKFPMTITVDVVDKLIKKNENENWTHRIMYM
jgi:ATP-dependent Lon protease